MTTTQEDPQGARSLPDEYARLRSRSGRRVLELLEREGVVIHPGYFFDFEHEGYWVVSLLPSPVEFKEAIHRVLRYLEVRL